MVKLSIATTLTLGATLVSAGKSYQRCPALDLKSAPKTSLLQKLVNPGVGADLKKVKDGMNQVYKDGYYEVACVNDGMRVNADKHGDGKFKYAA